MKYNNIHISSRWCFLFDIHIQLGKNVEMSCYNIKLNMNKNYNHIITNIASSQNYHFFQFLKNECIEELNFPTLFYNRPWPSHITQTFSYQQIVILELLHKLHDFATSNISNMFFKANQNMYFESKFFWLNSHNWKGKLCGKTLTTSRFKT